MACVDSLYRTALRLTHVPADAEDLVQETYLKAFRAADRFQAGHESEGLAVHHPSQHRAQPRARPRARHGDRRQRGRRSRRRQRRRLGRHGQVETPETLLLRDTLTPDLQAAVDALPDAFRQAVWLRDVEEFSYAEIAEMLAIPVGTVMSRISRGRRLLFDRLQHLRPVNA